MSVESHQQLRDRVAAITAKYGRPQGLPQGRLRSNTRPVSLAGAPRCIASTAGERLPIKIQNEGSTGIIRIYEHIGEDWYGEGVSASSVAEYLQANRTKPIEVFINSFGGSVYDGLTIYNSLAKHPKNVTTIVEGIAYSAASIIALGGNTMKMHKGSDFGIHCASIGVVGNKTDLLAIVDWLSTIDEHIVDIYADKCGKSRTQIEQWMKGLSDGTVFSATKAKELGFCDEVIDPKGKTATNTRTTATASRSGQHSILAAMKYRLALMRLRTR